MITKTLLLALLVVLATSYTEEGNVLVLVDDDFPDITTKFSHILIEFYAPWCGHCKKLAPVYSEVADALKAAGSPIRLAKVDATEQKKAPEQFGVRGYPTLFFFFNGQKMDYTGPRDKLGMQKWLEKRTRDPIVQIDAERYAALSQDSSVSVVYHGDLSSATGASVLSKLAVADDYNNFYWGTGLGRDEGTVQIIRNFGEPVTVSSIGENIKDWIARHQRPAVVDFDERTIGDMFGSGKRGVVLFNGDNSEELLATFTEAANQYDGESLIFTVVGQKNQHLDNFANYIRLDRKAYPIVVVDSKGQSKYVLKQSPSKESILSFLANYQEFKFGLTDQVKAEQQATQQEAEEQAEQVEQAQEQAEQL